MAPWLILLRLSEGSWARGAERSACALETEARIRGLEATVSEKPPVPPALTLASGWVAVGCRGREQNGAKCTKRPPSQGAGSCPDRVSGCSKGAPVFSALHSCQGARDHASQGVGDAKLYFIKGDVLVVISESILISLMPAHQVWTTLPTPVGRQNSVGGRALGPSPGSAPWCWMILCKSLALSELFPICTSRDQTGNLSSDILHSLREAGEDSRVGTGSH